VQVTARQAAFLKASLSLKREEDESLRKELAVTGELNGINELIHAAFALAVRQRFTSAWTGSDIVRYVGNVRMSGTEDDDIDPLVAETLIRRALGDHAKLTGDIEQQVTAQAILLLYLVADLELDATEQSQLMWNAQELADQWLADRSA
jgi:hypothetical protein